jgi:hypothetical protein
MSKEGWDAVQFGAFLLFLAILWRGWPGSKDTDDE